MRKLLQFTKISFCLSILLSFNICSSAFASRADHYPGNILSPEDIEEVTKEGCPPRASRCPSKVKKITNLGYSVYRVIESSCSMRSISLAVFCYENIIKAFAKKFIKAGKVNVAKKLSAEVFKPCNSEEGSSYKNCCNRALGKLHKQYPRVEITRQRTESEDQMNDLFGSVIKDANGERGLASMGENGDATSTYANRFGNEMDSGYLPKGVTSEFYRYPPDPNLRSIKYYSEMQV